MRKHCRPRRSADTLVQVYVNTLRAFRVLYVHVLCRCCYRPVMRTLIQLRRCLYCALQRCSVVTCLGDKSSRCFAWPDFNFEILGLLISSRQCDEYYAASSVRVVLVMRAFQVCCDSSFVVLIINDQICLDLSRAVMNLHMVQVWD